RTSENLFCFFFLIQGFLWLEIAFAHRFGKNTPLSAGNASATSEETHFFGDLQPLLFPQESACFPYAGEVVHSTYIHLDPAIMAVVWSGGPLTPVGIARVRRSL